MSNAYLRYAAKRLAQAVVVGVAHGRAGGSRNPPAEPARRYSALVAIARCLIVSTVPATYISGLYVFCFYLGSRFGL